MLEAVDELSLVSAAGFRSKNDDFLDTISMLGMMDTWRPMGDSLDTYIDTSGIWSVDESEDTHSIQSYVV
jgi:hypothetical protein